MAQATQNGFSKRVAMILSGCGNKDGAEITETVAAILALSEFQAQVEYFAPSREFTPVNFLTGESLPDRRNIMVEAARITRSQMNPWEHLVSRDFDALVIPGGFGVALHLSSWAKDGPKAQVDPVLRQIIEEFHAQSKPIVAICIAPAMIAKVLGPKGVVLTFGENPQYKDWGAATGAQVELCPSSDFVSDRWNKVISTPAYMNDAATPFEVFTGIRLAIKEMMEMA
jgi:enhancing lycopene biosynthesis protein 2